MEIIQLIKFLTRRAREPRLDPNSFLIFFQSGKRLVEKKLKTFQSKIVWCQHTLIEIKLVLVVLPWRKTGLTKHSNNLILWVFEKYVCGGPERKKPSPNSIDERIDDWASFGHDEGYETQPVAHVVPVAGHLKQSHAGQGCPGNDPDQDDEEQLHC